ncbi:MAG: mannonate dehydratase [Pirellulaceae bacterium]
MKLASVLTPLSLTNLRLAAQCGVEGVVIRYPGSTREALTAAKAVPEAHGLRVFAVEGYLPIERIKVGADRDGEDLEAVKRLIGHMGAVGIPLLCYNFMAGTDWVRTTVDAPERGGAKVTAFDVNDAERAVSLNAQPGIGIGTIEANDLWNHLERFLREVVPVAEASGVTLVMHPDDPPLPMFHGKARIMNSVENFERLMGMVPSPHNAICFCQGTFAAMGVDIPQTIRRLGKHIQYVHFRDVRGTAEAFTETFHDNGPTDMAAAITALRDIGFNGPIRPDHVPQLEGEDDGEPGYTMLGRLFAYGYIRGLLHGTGQAKPAPTLF